MGRICRVACASFLVALFAGVSPSVLAQSEPANCEELCTTEPGSVQALLCNCDQVALANPGQEGGGEPTAADPVVAQLIEKMIDHHEREMMFVQDHLVVERLDATPMPDLRYFEKGGDGEFVYIPVMEVQRRQTAAGSDGFSSQGGATGDPGGPSQESVVTQELQQAAGEDPAMMLRGLADAFEVIGDELIAPGALDGVADGFDEAAGGVAEAVEETRDGIAGMDDTDGLLGDQTLQYFAAYGKQMPGLAYFGEYSDRLAFTRAELTDDEISRAVEDSGRYRAGDQVAPGGQLLVEVVAAQITLLDIDRPNPETYADWPVRYSPTQAKLLYNGYLNGELGAFMGLWCRVITLDGTAAVELPALGGGEIERGELWTCLEKDAVERPIRIYLEYLDVTNAGSFVRRYVERVAADYRKVQYANLPHRLREATGKIRAALGSDSSNLEEETATEKRRRYLINNGMPTTPEWTDLLGAAMDESFWADPEFYPTSTAE